MRITINCIYNNEGAWCKNKSVKRSLFGIGARCCPLFSKRNEKCTYRKKFNKPIAPPPPPLPKRYFEKGADRTGSKCDTKGCKGQFKETTFFDDMDGVLHCTVCGKQIKRYK